MKIIGPEESGKIGFNSTQKKDGIKGGEDFSKILTEENNKVKGAETEKTGQVKQTTGPQFPSNIPLTALEPGGKAGETGDREKVVAMAEKILTQLEFFKSALENPKVDISKFSPLVESFRNNGNSLDEISTKISSNLSLKSLADEAATLAATESLKFHRGDYG